MYAQTWFFTLFAGFFSPQLVARIWDIYLVEGTKTIIRIALAIMHLKSEDLIQSDQLKIYFILQEF